MSLINDALRRASQAERNRPPQRAPLPLAMQPAPVARGSRISGLLIATVLLTLLLAAWFFWQWWMVRHDLPVAHPAPAVRAVPAALPVPAAAAPPAAVVAPPVKLAPVVPPPAVVSVPLPAAAHPAPSPAAPIASNFVPSPWPVDLRLNAIFFSKANPRALINGNVYGAGDDLDGISVKKIEKDKVTMEWNGHIRVLTLESP